MTMTEPLAAALAALLSVLSELTATIGPAPVKSRVNMPGALSATGTVNDAVVSPLYATTTLAVVDPDNAYGTNTLVADADEYRIGAGLPLIVTVVDASVVPTLPVLGNTAATRGEGPSV